MSLNSHFYQLARTITVSDICTPFLTTFESNRLAKEVYYEWGVDLCDEKDLDPDKQICLVTQNNKVVGWIGFDMLWEGGETIGECMDTIVPDSILSSDTSLFDAIKAFAQDSTHFYMILHGNQFMGWLSYQDLHKPPMRLCLFSMLINIEKMLLEVLLKNPEESINYLSQERIEEAKKIYGWRGYNKKENGSHYNSLLLECTTLKDRLFIAQRINSIRQKLPSLNYRDLCQLAKKIRNEVAHPTMTEKSSTLLSKEEFGPFIQWADQFELQLHNYLLENSSKYVLN